MSAPPGELVVEALTVVLGMGQAMDTWLMTQQPSPDELPRLIGALIEMIRGAVKP